MSFKIKRTDESEAYSVTADWLQDFLRQRRRETGSPVQNLKPIMQFSTIEEKMDDIKRRVGFGLVDRDKSIEITADEEECPCGGPNPDECACDVKTASDEKFEHDKAKMLNILRYIRDMIAHEPHLGLPVVIARLREEDGLGFEDLSIDMGKLNEFITSELERHRAEEHSEISYIPAEPEAGDSYSDTEADYYRHGNNFHN